MAQLVLERLFVILVSGMLLTLWLLYLWMSTRQRTAGTLVPPILIDYATTATTRSTRARRVAGRRVMARRGWRPCLEGYVGYYYAGGQSYRGFVRQTRPDVFVAYIWDPPLARMRHHVYWHCFVANGGGGRHLVQFTSAVVRLDQAIHRVEAMLNEAIRRTR